MFLKERSVIKEGRRERQWRGEANGIASKQDQMGKGAHTKKTVSLRVLSDSLETQGCKVDPQVEGYSSI